MKQFQLIATITCTDAQYAGKDVQDLLASVRNGSMKRDVMYDITIDSSKKPWKEVKTPRYQKVNIIINHIK